MGLENANGELSDSHFSVTRTQIDASIYGTMRGSGALFNDSFTVGEEMDFGDLLVSSPSQVKIKSGGVAFDLGAEARFLKDQLRVSVGITDLGFIAWSGVNAVAASFC